MIVIIGAGQAGIQTAISLRKYGSETAIVLVGEEAHPPYQRPPLSKAYLKGESDCERLHLKPLSWFETNNILLKMNSHVHAVDCKMRTVILSSGEQIEYEKLVFATGSDPHVLAVEGKDLNGVMSLRKISDVDALRPYIKPGVKIAIVGAGYIGLEAAAVCSGYGMEVSVFEAADRILTRVSGVEVAEFLTQYHTKNGVTFHFGAKVVGFEGRDGHVCGIQTEHHGEVSVDIVLMGVGIRPNSEIAESAGIACKNGILVDEDAKTSVDGVWAAGDCAARPIAQLGGHHRLESVHNAIEQGNLTAASIMQLPRPRVDVPWLWSDQNDLKLQTAGLLGGFDQSIIRGNLCDEKFSVWYFLGDKLLAVDAINSPPDFMVGKKLIQSQKVIDKWKISDTGLSLKELL